MDINDSDNIAYGYNMAMTLRNYQTSVTKRLVHATAIKSAVPWTYIYEFSEGVCSRAITFQLGNKHQRSLENGLPLHGEMVHHLSIAL